jgi:hypothetical protein
MPIPDRSCQRLWPTRILSLNAFATYCWMSLNAQASAATVPDVTYCRLEENIPEYSCSSVMPVVWVR